MPRHVTLHITPSELLEVVQQRSCLLVVLAIIATDWLLTLLPGDAVVLSQTVPYACLALIACLAILGPGGRVTRAALLLLFMGRVAYWVYHPLPSPSVWPREPALSLLYVLVPSLMCVLTCGLTIRRLDQPRTTACLQFDLRGILLLTGICGLALALTRAFQWNAPGLASPEFLFTTLGFHYGCLAILTMGLLLYLDNVGTGILLTLALALGCGASHAYLCRVDNHVVPFLTAHLGYVITLAVPLLTLRAAGYRIKQTPSRIAFSASWLRTLVSVKCPANATSSTGCIQTEELP